MAQRATPPTAASKEISGEISEEISGPHPAEICPEGLGRGGVGWRREGRVTFAVGNTFYRPRSALARDLAVLVATLEKQRLGHLRVLDAMTGSGVRPLRYLLEAGADWV